jgi:chromosomal replication initiator protein
MSTFWSHCLNHFENELSSQQFATWFRPLQAIEDGHHIIVVAPNSFVGKWVHDRFMPGIERLATEFFNGQARIDLRIGNAPAEKLSTSRSTESAVIRTNGGSISTEKAPLPSNEPARAPSVSSAVSPPAPETTDKSQTDEGSRLPVKDAALNTTFTFDTFVTGKANQLARAAGLQVAANPGEAYNPLFIYGGVGLGKTHLLHAIGRELIAHRPTARVSYIHAERYVSDVVKAYQHKAWDEFKRSYASLDLLLIDDIQFFNNKSSTQEQFFYLFNSLIEAKKQVIITCDTYPKEIDGIEDRLKSRFSWGLTVQVEPPETEMRVAILLEKAKQIGAKLDENVAFFIAKHIRSNVRELEGGLKRVIAYAGFHNVEISPQVAKDALRDLLAVQSRQVSIENIQKTVADYYKIKVSDMHSKKRSRVIARPRQMAMAMAKELTSMSLPEIGQNFGGRDHTTVLHACRQIVSLRESTAQIQHDYAFLLQLLRS